MAKSTPSIAKNQMKRCLNAILDPLPNKSAIHQLWAFFDSSCAYCGVKLARPERLGHLDHLIPQAAGGTNDIHNYVLTCARCNGDEKREENWQTFLLRKVSLASERQERTARIEAWMQQIPTSRVSLNVQEQNAANAVITQALQDFDKAVEELRAIQRNKQANALNIEQPAIPENL